MDQISQFFNFLDGILGSAAYFPIALLGAGVLFSFYLGFPQIRFFKHAWGGSRQYWRRGLCHILGRASGFILDVGYRLCGYDHKVCGSFCQS